jgi:hypothetical protein
MPAPITEAGLTLCFSCVKPRTDDQLGDCLDCGMRQCGMDDCTGACLCSLMREDDTGE